MKKMVSASLPLALLLLFGCSAPPQKGADTINQAQRLSIEANLRQISIGAKTQLLAEGLSEISFAELKSAGMVNSVRVVKGEEYSGLVVKATGGTLSVTTSNGETITHRY